MEKTVPSARRSKSPRRRRQGRCFQRHDLPIALDDFRLSHQRKIRGQIDCLQSADQAAKLHAAKLALLSLLAGGRNLLKPVVVSLPARKLFDLGQQIILVGGFQERGFLPVAIIAEFGPFLCDVVQQLAPRRARPATSTAAGRRAAGLHRPTGRRSPCRQV